MPDSIYAFAKRSLLRQFTPQGEIMSKAFTKELDEAPEAALIRPSTPLPPGVKNYLTRKGRRMLDQKLDQLQAGPPSPLSRRTIQEIQHGRGTSVVVDPPPPPWTEVLFGATVTVRDGKNEEATYRLVGVDEIELENNNISWRSPVGRALLKARLGARIRFNAPHGEETLEITGIRYE